MEKLNSKGNRRGMFKRTTAICEIYSKSHNKENSSYWLGKKRPN